MFKCPVCGCGEFYAKMECVLDVKVNGNNEFLDTMPEDCLDNIHDQKTPFGPYECVECGNDLFMLPEKQ